MGYLWYAGYGSNLCRERFCKYIEGGTFRLGGKPCEPCTNNTFLDTNKPIIIPHCLYFAYSAKWWGYGGVAFILPTQEENKNNYTYGRMWKVTEEQFEEIWIKEGQGLYNKDLSLGIDEEGIPIKTITSRVKLEFNTPSDNYIKTMCMGLKETNLGNKKILNYLIDKPGIKDKLNKEKTNRRCIRQSQLQKPRTCNMSLF